MNKTYNIICFSNIDWGFIFQRHQHMMTAFAEESCINKIIYIETLGTRKVKLNREDVMRIIRKLSCIIERLFQKNQKEDTRIHEKIYILSPVVIPIMHNFFYWINELFLSYQLRKVMNRLGIDEENTMAWVNLSHPSVFQLISKRNFFHVAYDCIDDTKSFPDMNKDIVDYEVKFIKSADTVFATSKKLYQYCKNYNNKVILLPNAVSEKWLLEKENSVDPCKKKIVGYVGTIYEWFDLDIVHACAKRFPEVDFRIVGPVRIDISDFDELNNVTFVGKVDYSQIENYIDSFNVCLIPFKRNDLTLNTNPVKIYEYFSKGKPTVSTNLPELEHYQKVMYLAKDSLEFVQCLEKALQESDSELREKRIEIAGKNTWKIRINMALEAINILMK